MGQRTAPLAPFVCFLLHCSNPPHEVPFVEALQWIVRGARRSAGSTASTPLSSFDLLVVGCRLHAKGAGGLAVECVSTRVPTNHLEAQASETRLQFARNLLE